MKNQHFAVLALLLLAAPAAEAQFTYDWSTGARTERTRLEAGRRMEFVVMGLNILCYTPNVRLTATEAKVDLARFVAGLTPPEVKAETESPIAPPLVSPPPPPPPPPPSPGGEPEALTALERASQIVDAALARISAARYAVAAAEESIEASEYFTDTYTAPPCERGRAWSITRFAEEWQQAGMLDRLDDARGGLRRAKENLADAANLLAEARRFPLATQDRETLRRSVTFGEDERRSVAADAERIENKLRGERQRLVRIRPALDALEQSSTMSTSFRASHDVEQVRLIVAMTPRSDPKTPQIAHDTIDEPVLRRFRMFVSTGMFMSFMPHRDYERINRPFLRDTVLADGSTGRVPTDSTYSTYANRRAGLGDVVSPTLQLNMVFRDLRGLGSGWPLMFSFGAAARTVGGSTLPEPFGGVSLGINDRILLSGGGHYGRNETLLLTLSGEQPEDVAERRIPASVTTADAVGTGWRLAPYLTISVRL